MFWLGLSLALLSAVAVNWAYVKEQRAAAALPPLTFRAPLRSVRSLLGARAWVLAAGLEAGGFLLYLLALRLAPLSIVQAVGAAGVAVLALVSCGGRIGRLTRREQIAVLFATGGLILLGLSLAGERQVDRTPSVAAVAVWLAACAVAALVVARVVPVGAAAARLGLAAGLLFAAGDITSKLVAYGGAWFAALVPLIACYALGTSVLQGAFQRGGALAAAGIATMATNAVPIAAGFGLFDEALPSGARGASQVAAFAALVVGATLLGRRSL